MENKDNVTWDPNDTFKGTAFYYSRFRPGYSSEVFEYLRERFRINGTHCILDLGCGTGQIALKMAGWVRKIYAVDPQEDMLEEGKVLARKKNITNIEWLVGQDSDVSSLVNDSVQATIIARAFHWMNRERVLEDLYSVTNPGGGVAIVGDSKFRREKAEWENVRNAVIERHIGKERKAGVSGTYSHPTKLHEEVLAESKFLDIKIENFNFDRKWTIDQIVGHCYSTSFCSKPLLGNRVEAFEKDLRAELLKLDNSGIFQDVGEFEVITAIK
ncbi:MAG: class I SAM-dependent methyltransferase [Rickettsiales bacterium]|nr:class I SAM-dependent methyltransferase [Rickettsiales bacterium]